MALLGDYLLGVYLLGDFVADLGDMVKGCKTSLGLGHVSQQGVTFLLICGVPKRRFA